MDGATGAVLWYRSGDELAATAGEVLLGDRDEQGRVIGLHLVRAADGTPIWDRTIAAAPSVAVSDGPAGSARIAYATTTGELTTLRYIDGVPLATRHVDEPPADPVWMPQVFNGRLYDVRVGSPTTVTAYRADTLAPLWRFEATGDAYVQDCGAVLCLTDARLTSAIDPETGDRRWMLPLSDVTPIGNGRLLLLSRDQWAGRTVMDAATGQVIGTAPPGTTILALDGGGLLALRDTHGPPYRVAVSRWDPETGRTVLLGAILGRADACQVTGRRLLCHAAGRMSVTDVG
jgi:outer membrane protein assembly factor BamB